MLIAKVKPSKYIFHLSLMVVSRNYHAVICKLNAILSYVLLLETILVLSEISYTLMYYPMFIKLSCAVVYFERLWSYAIVNLKKSL